VTGGFSLGFGYDQFTSCPHSVEITVPTSTNPGSAWLLKDVALLTNGEVIVDIDIRLPSNPTGRDFSLVEVRSGQSGTPPSSGLIYTTIGWQVNAGALSAALTMPNTPWVHCTLDVTFSSTSGIGTTMTIQGENAVMVADGSPVSLGSFATVAVGIDTTTTAPPGAMYYDNVVIRLK
jgi:hypothetical protein